MVNRLDRVFLDSIGTPWILRAFGADDVCLEHLGRYITISIERFKQTYKEMT